jgi:hypothetical protein
MTCQDAIQIMGDYLEAALGMALGADLERHLAECDECIAYLNTYRRTRELVGGTARREMPPQLKARLRAFLLARLAAPDEGSP